MRRLGVLLAAALLAATACSDDEPDVETSLVLLTAAPGDLIALRPADQRVEFVSRRTGEILRHSLDEPNLQASSVALDTLAVVAVGTEGEQRGLLGHTTIGDRRFAAWTQPDTNVLVVGEVTSGVVDRIVWEGTGTQSKAVGGHLGSRDGQLVLGIGSLTDWAQAHGSGAIVTLDPDGDAGQEPVVLSDGWNNPFAFTVLADGTIWVADNAPDGSDLPVDERDPERLGRGDVADAARTDLALPQRAPSAVVELPDGRLGVCGFLDGEMWAYEIVDDGIVERAGTIGPCLTAATVLDDGTIVTASTDGASSSALLVRSP